MAVAAFAYTKFFSSEMAVQNQPSVRRTVMSDGLPKQAQRYSRTLEQFSMVYFMSNAQFVSFRSWWDSTANHGTEWFNFTNPITDAVEDGRIINGAYTAVPFTGQQTHWRISMVVESWL